MNQSMNERTIYMKNVIFYLPTIVPIPRSLLVTNVPIMLVKNSGALVPDLN